MKKLENKTAIITGAASGMGKAIAQLFAQEGANIVLADLQQNEVDAVVKNIVEAGGHAIGLECNVSHENEIKNLIDKALSEYHTLDVLVNNAGTLDNFEPVDQVSNEQWKRVIGVNVDGPFFACRLAVPIMLKQGSGSIINIASIGGLFGARAGTAYTVSKHALIGLTKNIGFMYALNGIRCNAIAPGGVNTNIGKDLKPNSFGYQRCTIGGTSMPRMGEAIEIANTALFLASSDASLINGTVITADAGWTAY